MAYDEALADRIRRALGPRVDVTEKKMFGGLAFLLDGKMFCGIVKDELMVRVGPKHSEQALGEADVRPMDFTGRPMNGYVFVGPSGARTETAVRKWVEQGAAFVGALIAAPARRSAVNIGARKRAALRRAVDAKGIAPASPSRLNTRYRGTPRVSKPGALVRHQGARRSAAPVPGETTHVQAQIPSSTEK